MVYFDRPSELQVNTTVSSPIQLGDAFSWLRQNPVSGDTERGLRTVLVDVDGILFPFLRAFAHSLGQTWSEAECAAWKTYPTDHSEAELKAALAYAHSEAGLREHGLYDHAAAEIDRLRDHGLIVVVCTRRSEESGRWTQAVLRELGVHADQFIAGPKLDKAQIAKDLGAASLIDDKPKTILAALAAGLDVYSLAWPYNGPQHVESEHFVRSPSWPELTDRVLAGVQERLVAHRAR